MKTVKKALVTGAAGFLGRYCANELSSQGYQIVGLDLMKFDDFSKWGLFSFHTSPCSLNTLKEIFAGGQNPEIIIHCAGSGSVPASFQNPLEDFQANVVATMELLDFCRQQDKSIKIAIPSSAAVYGNAVKLPISEHSPLNPISPYGVHKKIIEELACSYATHFQLNISLVRFFSLYGEGLRKQLIWDACTKASHDNFKFDGDGSEVRDFLHVKDAAALMFLAATKASTSCPVVNGGTGTGTSIKDVLKLIGTCSVPPKEPSFSMTKRSGDPTNFIADVNELSRWGFRPQRQMSSEIKNYVDWFKKESNA